MMRLPHVPAVVRVVVVVEVKLALTLLCFVIVFG